MMHVSMRDHITCPCGATGQELEVVQACPIVYECQNCTQCIEVGCGNIDCLDCVDKHQKPDKE